LVWRRIVVLCDETTWPSVRTSIWARSSLLALASAAPLAAGQAGGWRLSQPTVVKYVIRNE
jgi:hypothetical protein